MGCVSPQKERKKEMPCPEKIALKSYLTPKEYEGVTEKAAQANLSISQYVRSVVLGYEVKSQVDAVAVLELTNAKADLARLGGLLKKGLGEHPDIKELRPLLHSIEKTHKDMKGKFDVVVKMFCEKE